MSSIATLLNQILRSVYGKDVRQAIHDAISQCYDDVNAPALQTEAMQAAVQAKIDAGEMAALTIADGSLTGAKLANGTIPTAKIADGAITMDKLSDDIDLDVETDTTLTQQGVPADAKAVGDVLAEMGTLTGEPLEDNEAMKYIVVSRYEDFKLIDGYGYFDAKMLMNSICGSQPYNTNGRYNYVFRLNPESGKTVLIPTGFNTTGILGNIFSPAFSFEEVEWQGDSAYIGATQEGFFISKDPNPIRTSVYLTIPKSLYGESASLGDYMFNSSDTIGILMDVDNIVEYDPSTAISEATFGAISEATVEGELFYKGQININPLVDIIGIADNGNNRSRVYSSFGFIDSSNNYGTYAKEYVNMAAGSNQTRFYYTVKASGAGAKTVDAIKNYLINVRHLKFYYVQEATE